MIVKQREVIVFTLVLIMFQLQVAALSKKGTAIKSISVKTDTVSMVPTGGVSKADTLFAEDFGIKPDTRKDMTRLLQQLVDRSKTNPGRY